MRSRCSARFRPQPGWNQYAHASVGARRALRPGGRTPAGTQWRTDGAVDEQTCAPGVRALEAGETLGEHSIVCLGSFCKAKPNRAGLMRSRGRCTRPAHRCLPVCGGSPLPPCAGKGCTPVRRLPPGHRHPGHGHSRYLIAENAMKPQRSALRFRLSAMKKVRRAGCTDPLASCSSSLV